MSEVATASAEMIAENPSVVSFGGGEHTVFLGPVQTFDLNEGADSKQRTMISISEFAPTSPVGIPGEGSWTVSGNESVGGEHISELTQE